MKEPEKIKLTDSPQTKRANLIPLLPIDKQYPEPIHDDLYIKSTNENNLEINNEDNK